jgi:hypothetical protein
VLLTLAALAVIAPSAALAGGTNVKVSISGAGTVVEPGASGRINCSNSGAGSLECDEVYWDSLWVVHLEAVPMNRHWKFANWVQGGGGNQLNCAVNGNRCDWTSGICVLCAFHYTLGAEFVRHDYDSDGYVEPADCNDDVAAIHPNAADIPDNGIDEDCSGSDAVNLDRDGDGYNRPGDCNDSNPAIHPNATDIPDNGIDEDCSGSDAVNLDRDGDGFNRPADCDDTNKAIHPGATDRPDNGVDEDCDGRDGINPDRDGDGFNRPGLGGQPDCDDTSKAIHPGAIDVPDNGIDEDCSGSDAVNLDRDGDGFNRPADCDDTNKAIHPGAREVADNGVDEDCKDGDFVDTDRDDDGYDRPADCNDANPAINPGAREVLDNNVDENCDTVVSRNSDRDGDGFSVPLDCDDANPDIHPGATERRGDRVDENCDGRAEPWPQIISTVLFSSTSNAKMTRLKSLIVKGVPAGATVTVTCKGKGCTSTRNRRSVPSGSAELNLGKLVRRAKLAPKTVIEVSVTHPQMSARIVRLTMRRGKLPAVTTLCKAPTASQAAVCSV